MPKLMQVQNETFEKEVLRSSLPTLVDFHADWCDPCQAMAPVVEEIAGELKGQLKVVQVNVDGNEPLYRKYEVYCIPTLVLFQGGREVHRIEGFLPKARLIRWLQRHLSLATMTRTR
ncbi:thioredoxin [Candidatus Acetothermia bacterium]|nr:thioredoxin [Candidatus Acetothermia bacterium]